MKKTLIILRGLPGSGKSFTADILANTGIAIAIGFGEPEFKYPICTADDYFMKDGKYMFNASKLGAAHKTCQAKCEFALSEGLEKVFVANTSTTQKELSTYYKLAEKYGYIVVSLIVENRHDGKNTHDVPEEALERMRERFDIKIG